MPGKRSAIQAPDHNNTQGLKITGKNVLLLLRHLRDILFFSDKDDEP